MIDAGSLRLSEGDHLVHFYDDAEDHVRAVSEVLSAALLAGESVVILARSTRCQQFKTAIQRTGVDVDAAEADHRFVALDAEATLAKFMVGSSPDPDRFDATVGGLLRRVGATGEVCAYGEMVGLLWESGNVSAAIELEELWTSLAERISFSLICGYERGPAYDAAEVEAFAEVCHRHSAVIGGPPGAADADEQRRFAHSKHAPRAARRFVEQALHRWGHGHVIADALLVVSELAANAVVHAKSDFTVALIRRPGVARIVVGDRSPSPPMQRNGEQAVGGHGLRLVAGLAEAWGTELVANGKLVWADLDVIRSQRVGGNRDDA